MKILSRVQVVAFMLASTLVAHGKLEASDGGFSLDQSDVRMFEDILGDPNSSGHEIFKEFENIRQEAERILPPTRDGQRADLIKQQRRIATN